jgi:hypothetical protein
MHALDINGISKKPVVFNKLGRRGRESVDDVASEKGFSDDEVPSVGELLSSVLLRLDACAGIGISKISHDIINCSICLSLHDLNSGFVTNKKNIFIKKYI